MESMDMEVKVIKKEAFSVIGIEGTGLSREGPRWVKPLWTKATGRVDEISQYIKKDAWGMMSAVDEYLAGWKDKGKYLAGWELKGKIETPDGWVIWDIPSMIYAVVPCRLDAYEQAMNKIVKNFLPDSEYSPSGAIHEYYSPEFKNIEKDPFFLYCQISKRH